MTNVAPGMGGIERDPSTLASHDLLPGGRAAMLRRCVRVQTRLEQRSDGTYCIVTLLAQDVGHRVPTGFIDRHLLLVIEPFDRQGRLSVTRNGPRLPAEAGSNLAGLPGQIFGRLLVDQQGAGPVPFWRAAELAQDTRLVPGQPTVARYVLPSEARSVRVRLLYRRFWQHVAAARQWPDDTITVSDQTWDVVRAAGASP